MKTEEIVSAMRARIGDRQAFFCTLVGEVLGEPVHGQIAVACVIRNRVAADLHNDGKKDWWGEGYAGVCLAPWQFSCWYEPLSPNSERVYALANAMIDKTAIPEGINAAALAQLRWIVDGVLGAAVIDPTNGATHYVTTKLLNSDKAPAWALTKVDGVVAPKRPCAVIGAHSFFKGIE